MGQPESPCVAIAGNITVGDSVNVLLLPLSSMLYCILHFLIYLLYSTLWCRNFIFVLVLYLEYILQSVTVWHCELSIFVAYPALTNSIVICMLQQNRLTGT